MVIAVDIDNVLNQFTQCVLNHYNADSGDHLVMEDMTAYYMAQFLRGQFREKLPEYFGYAARGAPVIPGAKEGLKKLNEEHTVFLVTSTAIPNLVYKFEWVKRNFPFIQEKQVVRMDQKTYFQCDVMIDDNEEQLIGGSYEKIIVDYPWNRCGEFGNCDDRKYGLRRVSDWNGILEEVNAIEKEYS